MTWHGWLSLVVDLLWIGGALVGLVALGIGLLIAYYVLQEWWTGMFCDHFRPIDAESPQCFVCGFMRREHPVSKDYRDAWMRRELNVLHWDVNRWDGRR